MRRTLLSLALVAGCSGTTAQPAPRADGGGHAVPAGPGPRAVPGRAAHRPRRHRDLRAAAGRRLRRRGGRAARRRRAAGDAGGPAIAVRAAGLRGERGRRYRRARAAGRHRGARRARRAGRAGARAPSRVRGAAHHRRRRAEPAPRWSSGRGRCWRPRCGWSAACRAHPSSSTASAGTCCSRCGPSRRGSCSAPARPAPSCRSPSPRPAATGTRWPRASAPACCCSTSASATTPPRRTEVAATPEQAAQLAEFATRSCGLA